MVQDVSQIAFEAAKLVHLHVIHHLQNGIQLPIMDQAFFYSATCAVSSIGQEKAQSGASASDVATNSLQDTFRRLYAPLRPLDLRVASRSPLPKRVIILGPRCW